MPTSSTTTNTQQSIRQQVVALCWGAWTELGVSGWARTHQEWAIDPEPLIIFTAGIADLDPRLRDEATDWCIGNWRHISQARLRNLLTPKMRMRNLNQENDFPRAWGQFAATVNDAAGTHWPLASSARPYKVTGRSILRPLTEPSLVFLRMRAIFGLGARTEILRFLLFSQERATAATLAERTNYAKRNVSEVSDLLVQAGVLQVRPVRNRFYFSLPNPAALEDFIGAIPPVVPDWRALLNVAETVLRVDECATSLAREVLVVETHQAAEVIEEDLDLLHIDAPGQNRGAAFLEAWNEWASSLLEQLASGQWPMSKEQAFVRQGARNAESPSALHARTVE